MLCLHQVAKTHLEAAVDPVFACDFSSRSLSIWFMRCIASHSSSRMFQCEHRQVAVLPFNSSFPEDAEHIQLSDGSTQLARFRTGFV